MWTPLHTECVCKKERWPSGRRRTTRNRVGGNVSGVRIPLSPLKMTRRIGGRRGIVRFMQTKKTRLKEGGIQVR